MTTGARRRPDPTRRRPDAPPTRLGGSAARPKCLTADMTDPAGGLPASRLRPRLWSLLLDYLVIACWIGVLTVVGLAVRPMLPPADSTLRPAAFDLVAFVMTVLPVWGYLTITEAGRRQATFGKRAAGLRVLRADDAPASGGAVALRNAVKLLPWQLAHVAVARFMLAVDLGLGTLAYVASLALVVLTVLMAVRDPLHRGLHDRVAGTRVVSW